MSNTTVNLSVVAQNRKPISMVGANLGTMYFKAEARANDNQYKETVENIKANGNVDFYLNRVSRRFRMTGHEVLSVEVASDAVGATKVILNRNDENSSVSIPVSANMQNIGGITDDAINKALRGDKNIIFANAKKLADQLNTLNNDEISRLKVIRSSIDKAIQAIESAIQENNRKADTYEKEIIASTPEIIPAVNNDANVENGGIVIVED